MSIFDGLYRGTQSVEDGRVDGRGIGAWMLNPFVDEDQLNRDRQRTINEQTAIAGNHNLDDLGLDGNASVQEVQGAIISRNKEDRKTEKAADQANALKPLQMQLADQAAARQEANQLTLRQMIDNKEIRLADLEHQKMRDRRADMEYNERMDRADRKDRQMMMQSLAAGLASLGAAFAL